MWIRQKNISRKLKIHIRWFGHIMRRDDTTLNKFDILGRSKRGIPKLTWKIEILVIMGKIVVTNFGGIENII